MLLIQVEGSCLGKNASANYGPRFKAQQEIIHYQLQRKVANLNNNHPEPIARLETKYPQALSKYLRLSTSSPHIHFSTINHPFPPHVFQDFPVLEAVIFVNLNAYYVFAVGGVVFTNRAVVESSTKPNVSIPLTWMCNLWLTAASWYQPINFEIHIGQS